MTTTEVGREWVKAQLEGNATNNKAFPGKRKVWVEIESAYYAVSSGALEEILSRNGHAGIAVNGTSLTPSVRERVAANGYSLFTQCYTALGGVVRGKLELIEPATVE